MFCYATCAPLTVSLMHRISTRDYTEEYGAGGCLVALAQCLDPSSWTPQHSCMMKPGIGQHVFMYATQTLTYETFLTIHMLSINADFTVLFIIFMQLDVLNPDDIKSDEAKQV